MSTTEIPPGLNALIDALQSELRKLRAVSTGQTPHDVPSPMAGTKVRDHLKAHPGDHRRDIARLTGLHPRTVSKALEGLQASGAVVRLGQRRGSRWFLVETLDKLTSPK